MFLEIAHKLLLLFVASCVSFDVFEEKFTQKKTKTQKSTALNNSFYFFIVLARNLNYFYFMAATCRKRLFVVARYVMIMRNSVPSSRCALQRASTHLLPNHLRLLLLSATTTAT